MRSYLGLTWAGKPKPTAYKLCNTLTFAICKGIPAVRGQTNRLTRVTEGPDQVGETLLLAYQGYVKIMIDHNSTFFVSEPFSF